MIVRLSLPSAFSFDAIVRSHGWYDLPPFAYEQETGLLRTFVARGRKAVAVAFRIRGGRLEAEADTLDRDALREIARRVFSLDVELNGFAQTLAGEPALARALSRGGGRMLRAPALFEDAVKVLLTTNCTWAATKGMVTRLIAQAGAQGRAFPTPEAVAALSASSLKSKIRCGYRAGPLALFSRRVASGRLDLARWQSPQLPADEVRESILAESGFGPYAAEGLLRIFGRHDFLALDSWIRQKYRQLYPGPAKTTDGSIARRYARFGIHKGLALWLDMTRDWHEQREEPKP